VRSLEHVGELADRLVPAAGQAIIVTTPAGSVLAWNPQAETLYGWTVEEALGRNIAELTPSAQAIDEAEAIMKTLRSGQSWSGEFPVRRKDGSTFVAYVSDTPVLDENGDILTIVGVSHDATQRRLYERSTEREAAMLRLALDAASIGTWTWNIEDRSATWDSTMGALFGRGPDAFEFGSLASYLHPDDAGLVMEAVESARHAGGGKVANEFRVIWPDGSIHWLLARGRFVYRDGSPDAMVGIVADIDERKGAEAARAETVQVRTAHDRQAIQVLQEALIRPEFPDVAHFDLAARYLPADSTELGGDWYDSFTLVDGRIMISVGDVAGHGIRAARLMAKLRHATRAYACIDPDPSYVLRQLDAFLQHFGIDGEFATVQLAALDPSTGAYELVSAGHPPPLCIREEKATLLATTATPPVGAALLPETIIPYFDTLSPGHALLLYTDGLIERHDEPIDQGLRRLTESVPLLATSDELCDAALKGCLTGHHRSDDICVFAIRRNWDRNQDGGRILPS
jgi:PAS domain S-box-containing protein